MDDWQGLAGRVLRKAAQDPTFRAALFTDPRAAIEGAIPGLCLPTNISISVLEETANHYYLVMRTAAPGSSAPELDE